MITKHSLQLFVALLGFFISVTVKANDEILSYRLSTANGLPDNNIRSFSLGSKGIIYFNAPYDTYAFDGYTFRQVDSKQSSKGMYTPRGMTVTDSQGWEKDNMGNKYRVSNDGVVHIQDRQTNETLHLHIFDPKLLQLSMSLRVFVVTDIRGLIWIAVSGNGIFIYNKHTQQLRHITKEDKDPLIDSNYIVALMADKCGNIWASQEHMGVVCLKMIESKYHLITVNEDSYQSRNIRMVRRLADGQVYMCNNAGDLYSSNGRLGHLQCVMKGKNILTAFKDSKGRLFLGSRKDGICIDGKWTCKGRIECIVEDHKGRIWACGIHNGLYVADKGTSTFRQVMSDLRQRQIVIDHKTGNFLVASDSGLICFNPDKLLKDKSNYQIILKELCRCVYIRPNNDIWIGTANKGIFVRKNRTKRFINLTHHDGLPINAITFILETPKTSKNNDKDALIIGTENGLVMYADKRFHKLFFSNKPLNNFCHENAYAILDNGNIAVGTLDGLIVAETTLPLSVKSLVKKPISISEIMANGVSVLPGEWNSQKSGNQQLTLNHNTDNLTFYFSTYDFTDKDNVDFSYILEGYDMKWSPASTSNFASYKNLKPGHYRFRVRYRDANGNWIESTDTCEIKILSPWWASWWAYLIYIIVTLVIAMIVYRQVINTQRLKHKLKIEKQLAEYKIRFFTNVSHEFRTPLTLIQDSMQRIKALRDVPGDLRQPLSNMQRDVSRMMRLINQLLEFRKMQNNKLSLALQETDVVTLLHNIWINFHDTAENKGISYQFIPQKKSLITVIDRDYVDKIVYNLLSNAFKYTPKGGSITLKLNTDENYMNIIVADTGIGIPKEEQTKIFERYSTGKVDADSIGIGLHLTQELVRVHHGEITLHENSPKGAIFTVSLPLDKTVYSEADYIKEVPEMVSNTIIEKQGFKEEVSELAIEPMNDKTILIVDDTPELCEMIAKEMGRYFHVQTATNGQEALTLLQHSDTNNIDLVISDIKMPLMDGFELTKRIRKDKSIKTLPVVLLTSLTDDKKQLHGLDVGADAYIIKPFKLSVLVSQCAMLIKQRELLKNAYSISSKPNTTDKEVVKTIIREEKDLKFIKQLDQTINKKISDTSLDIDSLSAIFGMGRTTFYAKVKSLTGKTPNEYISDIRLNMAAKLLREDTLQVGEVAVKTGFNSPQYLARNFKKKFGLSPSEYAGKSRG